MDLQLGLSLSTSTFYLPNCKPFDDDFASAKRRRGGRNAVACDDQIIKEPPTLTLFGWSNQPNEEDDDDESSRDSNTNSSSSICQNIDEKDDGIIGWPPIKFRRRKMRQNPAVGNGCADCHGRLANSKYVKVKMEGVTIARKIDLTNFNSVQQLKQTLIGMFGICEENSSSYELSYQDRKGDWLLAEDVSWRCFMGSVQRLKLMRSKFN